MEAHAQNQAGSLFNTASEWIGAIAQCGLPQIDRPGLSALVTHFGKTALKGMVRSILDRQGEWETAHQKLGNACKFIQADTVEKLKSCLGNEVPLDLLVALSQDVGHQQILKYLSAPTISPSEKRVLEGLITEKQIQLGVPPGADAPSAAPSPATMEPPPAAAPPPATPPAPPASAVEYSSEEVEVQSAPAGVKEHHVYGGKGAICFTTAMARENRYATLRVEGAANKGPRSYAWDKKVSIQLSKTELLDLLAVMQGWVPEMSLVSHGTDKDKSLSIKRQEEAGRPHFYVTVRQKDGANVAAKMSVQNAFYVSSLVIEQLQHGSPHLDAEMVCRLAHKAYCLPPLPVVGSPQ
jgi:hypothetical protein